MLAGEQHDEPTRRLSPRREMARVSFRTVITVPALRRARLRSLIDGAQSCRGYAHGEEPCAALSTTVTLPAVDTAAAAANRRNPLLGEPVRGSRGRYALLVGDRKNLAGRGEDLARFGLGPIKIEALELVRDLYHAARVDHIIRCVKNAAVGQLLLHARMRQLVVRATAYDLRRQRRDRRLVKGTAERTRRVDVGWLADQR